VIWENEPSRYWEASLNRQADSSPLPNWTRGTDQKKRFSRTFDDRRSCQSRVGRERCPEPLWISDIC
jgi:hypothetical protein